MTVFKFTIGDAVTWTSQATGISKIKHRTVVQVVPPKVF